MSPREKGAHLPPLTVEQASQLSAVHGFMQQPSILSINHGINTDPTVMQLIGADPCGAFGHRWAYLAAGGVECDRCGARR